MRRWQALVFVCAAAFGALLWLSPRSTGACSSCDLISYDYAALMIAAAVAPRSPSIRCRQDAESVCLEFYAGIAPIEIPFCPTYISGSSVVNDCSGGIGRCSENGGKRMRYYLSSGGTPWGIESARADCSARSGVFSVL